jgi:hypothetical protein
MSANPLEQSSMKRILSLALLLTAGAAQAAPTAAVPASQAPTPKRFPGVSDAGNAALAKAQTTPDPQLQQLSRQARAAHDQVVTAVMAPVIGGAASGGSRAGTVAHP